MRKKKLKNPTIDELKALLDSEEDFPLTILPNGEVRAFTKKEKKEFFKKVPLTYKEDLGGEYAEAA